MSEGYVPGQYDEPTGFKLPEEGWHTVRISDIEFGRTRKGDDKIVFEHKFSLGGGKFFTKKLHVVKVPTWWGLGRFDKIIAACKVPPSSTDPNGVSPFDEESVRRTLLGKYMNVLVTHKTEPSTKDPSKDFTSVELEDWKPANRKVSIPFDESSNAAKYGGGGSSLPAEADGFDDDLPF